MNLPLSPELKTFLKAQVDSGRYRSEEAVCVAALEAFSDQEQHRQARLAALHRDVMIGAAEADRGELLDGESAMQALRDKLESWKAGKSMAWMVRRREPDLQDYADRES